MHYICLTYSELHDWVQMLALVKRPTCPPFFPYILHMSWSTNFYLFPHLFLMLTILPLIMTIDCVFNGFHLPSPKWHLPLPFWPFEGNLCLYFSTKAKEASKKNKSFGAAESGRKEERRREREREREEKNCP